MDDRIGKSTIISTNGGNDDLHKTRSRIELECRIKGAAAELDSRRPTSECTARRLVLTSSLPERMS